MNQKGLNILDKLHSNLLESGKISRRLTWIIFILCIFFFYLIENFSNLPPQLRIGIFFEPLIYKKDIVLISPIVIAALNLASILMYIYIAALHVHLQQKMAEGNASIKVNDVTLNYLHYPSFENLLRNISEENETENLIRIVFKTSYLLYKVLVRGLPFFFQLYFLWKAFQINVSNVWKIILFLSLIPVVMAIIILSRSYHSVIKTIGLKLSSRLALKIAYFFTFSLIALIISTLISTSLFQKPALYYSFEEVPIAGIDKKVSDKIRIFYKDEEITNLILIKLKLVNKGNKFVESITGDFSLLDKSNILDFTISGVPDIYPEIISKYKSYKFQIDNLNPLESVNFEIFIQKIDKQELKYKFDIKALGVSEIKKI